MNQILQTNETNNKNGKPIDTKKIVLFLGIIIAVFGFIFGIYLIVKNINNGNKKPIEPVIEKATITLTQTEDDKVSINISSKTGLSSITYNWNDETSQVIELNGETNIEKILDIPFGENTIHIIAMDINKVVTQKEKTFIMEVPKPEIELSIVGNYIKMAITSKVDLSEITYQWNSETQKKENMVTYEDKKTFEKQLEIPLGENTLKIVATDINGGVTEKSQQIKGITRAKTTTQVDGEYWHFTVTGTENIKTVEFEFNGQRYIMDTSTFGQTKVVHYKVKLIEGKNILKITSITESDGVNTTTWEQDYVKEANGEDNTISHQ